MRPNKAPRIELPMDNARSASSAARAGSTRARGAPRARRIWSWSCCSFACQRLRSSATAASRFSRAASARRARKSPSDSPAFEAALNASLQNRLGARGLVQMRLQAFRPGGVTGRAQRGPGSSPYSAPSRGCGGQARLELRIAGWRLPRTHCRHRHRTGPAIRRSATRRARVSHRRNAAWRSRRSWACRAPVPRPSWGSGSTREFPRPPRGATPATSRSRAMPPGS